MTSAEARGVLGSVDHRQPHRPECEPATPRELVTGALFGNRQPSCARPSSRRPGGLSCASGAFNLSCGTRAPGWVTGAAVGFYSWFASSPMTSPSSGPGRPHPTAGAIAGIVASWLTGVLLRPLPERRKPKDSVR